MAVTSSATAASPASHPFLVDVSGAALETQAATELPAATIDAPRTVGATGATITGSVNPKGDIATWRVQTSRDPSCAGGFQDQALHSIDAASESPVEVEYPLTGLLPSEHYCVRVLATNSVGSTASAVEEFETLEAAPTQVFTAFAGPRTDASARLNGYVNPQGSEATFHFEYSADGSTWISLRDRQTRPAGMQIMVGEEVTGLKPDTVYHYRFSVETGGGTAEGQSRTFRTRTLAEVQLPRRGNELVNKPDKGNQNILPSTLFENSAPVRTDGEAVLWKVIGGAPGGNTASEAIFLATRAPSGWKSKPIIPAADRQVGGGALNYKFNESNGAFTQFLFHVVRSGSFGKEGPPTFVAVDGEGNQRVLRSFPESFGFRAWLNTETTEDMSRGFIVPFDTDQLEELAQQGSLSVMPEGLPSQCGLGGSSGFTGPEGDAAAAQWRKGYHRIDKIGGSRAYFQSVPNGAPCESGMGIYTRDLTSETTTEIDSGSATSEPQMIRATPDGGSLYFVTSARHSPDDENAHNDVYRWDAGSGTYTCLTCVVPDAHVEGTVLVSDDFSHVYFSSGNQLINGYGEPDDQNVYVLSNGEIRFVTDLGRSSEALSRFYSDVSADGNVLIFRTAYSGNEELTADPLSDSGCKLVDNPNVRGRCQELYRYEATTESLECVSCRPGAPTDANIGSPGTENWYAVSADGDTVAFVTRERLLSRDVNGTFDVYEWHDGSIGLITDGTTQYPVNGGFIAPKVYGIDGSGENIFFTVVAPGLTGYEEDGVGNLYDARDGGGFPRPQPPLRCTEESCQGSLEVPPEQPAAASASFHGTENLRHRSRCRKGRFRRHGHCVKRRRPKKGQARRRHGKRHTPIKHRSGP